MEVEAAANETQEKHERNKRESERERVVHTNTTKAVGVLRFGF